MVLAHTRAGRVTRVLLAAMLLGALAPGSAVAASPDPYEAAGDNTAATARDITPYVQGDGPHWFGGTQRVETHTFHMVDDSTPESDEDWVKFSVSDTDVYNWAHSYMFDAVSSDRFVDPVVEIYGPGLPATVTAPGDLSPSALNSEVTETDPFAIGANDDGIWFDRRASSLSFVPEVPGVYYVRVRPYYQYAGGADEGFRGGEGSYTLSYKVGQFSRLAGQTRVDTSLQISRERFPSEGPASKAAILASAYSFPDALSGSTLAGAIRGPVLLTATASLPDSVRAEIDRLDVETVYILGGTLAVSDGVKQAVEAILTPGGANVSAVRLGGTTRAHTARLIAQEASKITSASPVAFVVSSQKFPDALASSPMAVHNINPILLTAPTTLDPHAKALIESPAITDVVIVGGTGSVSAAVQSQIASLLGGTDHVRRIQGNDRYQTARNFAVWATGPTVDVEHVGTPANPAALETLHFQRIGVASGEKFPDALAGGVFCGLARSPLLLTRAASLSPALLDFDNPSLSAPDYWRAAPYQIERSYIFGGTSSVDQFNNHLILDLFSGRSAF